MLRRPVSRLAELGISVPRCTAMCLQDPTVYVQPTTYTYYEVGRIFKPARPKKRAMEGAMEVDTEGAGLSLVNMAMRGRQTARDGERRREKHWVTGACIAGISGHWPWPGGIPGR